MFDNKDVSVLDLTHGGIPLARHIAKTATSVTGIDVYGTVDPSVLYMLKKECIDTARTIPHHVDILVAPIHLDPDLMPDYESFDVMTHHRAAGELMTDAHLKGKVIEITGTSAKTGTAALLADMASHGMSVISHTSRGVEHWINGVPSLLHHGLSIAPGNIMKALEFSEALNPDLYIFEISLGGTGAADLGIITTLANEYTIANGHRTSTEAKKQMIQYAKPGSTLLIDSIEDHIDAPEGVETVTFSSTSEEADVYLEQPHTDLWTIHYGDQTIRFRPNAGYNAHAYTTAILCAAAAATVLKLDPASIESTLLDFQGVHGRMRLVEWADRTIVDNSNSGMNPRAAREALDYANKIASENDSRLLFIIGEEAKQVCEGLDPEEVSTFIKDHGSELDSIILVGERMHAIQGDNIHYASGLNTAIEMAEALTEEQDIIISCVKCFR